MSKKHSKGITYESQMENLAAVDRLLSGGDIDSVELLPEDSQSNSFSESDFIGNIFDMLEERKRLREYQSDNNEDAAGSVTEAIPDKNESQQLTIAYNTIQIKRKVSPDCVYDLVEFTDSVRTFTIDLATLAQDKEPFDTICPFQDINVLASMLIGSVTPNFYPGMMTSKDIINSEMRHIVEFESEDYRFYEYDDGHNNFVMGYRYSEGSLDLFYDICRDLIDRGFVLSFLKAVIEMTSIDGFCFRGMPVSYIKQIMLTEYMNTQSHNFINDIMSNDEIVTVDDCHINDSVDSIISILPYNFMEDDLDQILFYEDDDEDLDDSEDELDEHEYQDMDKEKYEEETENTEESNCCDVDVNDALFSDVEGVQDVSCMEDETAREPERVREYEYDRDDEKEESRTREQDLLRYNFGYSSDPDRAESEYYARKGQKPPKQESRSRGDRDIDRDDAWIIRSR